MDKEKSYKIYKAALKDGTLQRMTTCEKCGESEKRIYGHHEDYNKPTDIMWLCGRCHKKRHIVKDIDNSKPQPSNARPIEDSDFTVSYIMEMFNWSQRGLVEYWAKNSIDFYCDGYDFFVTESDFRLFLDSFTSRSFDD
jgi:ribosomal protein S27AE